MTVTGVGSMPGTNSAEVSAIVCGELPDLPHVPELPARGAGADIIGRTASLVAQVAPEFGCAAVPSGWRLAGVGADMRRATSLLNEDLDHVEHELGTSSGAVKVQVAGPWTMAGSVEGRSGQRTLADAGLVRELTQALALALRSHIVDLVGRLPNRQVTLQLDEPLLPAVLQGALPTASKRLRHRPVEVPDAVAGLETVLGVVDAPDDQLLPSTVLHCCADYPFEVANRAGVAGYSLDLLRAPGDLWDESIAEAVEAGRTLLAGVVPAIPDEVNDQDRGLSALARLWSRTGLARESLSGVIVTPTCGLAGCAPDRVREVIDTCLRISSAMEPEQ